MKRYINTRFSLILVLVGAIICGIGYAVALLDLLSIYGKVADSSTCWHVTNSCSVSNNLIVANVGRAIIYVGFITIGIGIAVLLLVERRKK